MDVPGFRTAPTASRWPSVTAGGARPRPASAWSLVMLIALAHGDGAGDTGRRRARDLGVASVATLRTRSASTFRGTWRFLGSLVFNVAIFLLPMTIDVAARGASRARRSSVWRAVRGRCRHSPTCCVTSTAASVAAWWGWLLPARRAARARALSRGSPARRDEGGGDRDADLVLVAPRLAPLARDRSRPTSTSCSRSTR